MGRSYRPARDVPFVVDTRHIERERLVGRGDRRQTVRGAGRRAELGVVGDAFKEAVMLAALHAGQPLVRRGLPGVGLVGFVVFAGFVHVFALDGARKRRRHRGGVGMVRARKERDPANDDRGDDAEDDEFREVHLCRFL